MSGQHTQGRLEVYETGDGPTLIKAGEGWLYGSDILGGAPGNAAYIANEEDARRLAACWNLCEHVSTNDVEMMNKGGGLLEVLAVSARGAMADNAENLSLKKQLDAARALLEEVAMELYGTDRAATSVRIRAFLKGTP